MSSQGFLARAHKFLIYLGAAYVLLLVLICTPVVQRNLLYLHHVPWPLRAKFDQPQRYGLAPYKTMNVNISTPDNQTLGAWFIFSESYYQTGSPSHTRRTTPFCTSCLRRTLSQNPTILFFHGNAATRAARYRVALYSALSTRLGANVLAVDYRGFADSTGTPSERGLAVDGRAAWDWLIDHGAGEGEGSVTVVGHSLGTSVAAMLGESLAQDDLYPRGIVLIAPFSSILSIARTYSLFGFIPLLRPLLAFPGAFEVITKFLVDKLDTLARLSSIKSPILLIHGLRDPTIPPSHASALFASLLEPLLPPLPFSMGELARPKDDEVWKVAGEIQSERNRVRESVVSTWSVPGFVSVQEFERNLDGDVGGLGRGRVMHVEVEGAGHVDVLGNEGVLDIIGDFVGISRRG